MLSTVSHLVLFTDIHSTRFLSTAHFSSLQVSIPLMQSTMLMKTLGLVKSGPPPIKLLGHHGELLARSDGSRVRLLRALIVMGTQSSGLPRNGSISLTFWLLSPLLGPIMAALAVITPFGSHYGGTGTFEIWGDNLLLCRLRSIVAHRDHFVCLSVCPSVRLSVL